MGLLDRFGDHWHELREHLRDDRHIASMRTDLELRPTGRSADTVALEEAKHVLDMELAGSGSLNTRGTQLAGLTGATIALVGTLAEKWLGSTGGVTRTTVGVLVILAMLALFGAMYCAVIAVLPVSKWRRDLEELLGEDLSGTGRVDEAALRRAIAGRYLAMAEAQRDRNQAKADDMLLSYAFLVSGVLVLLVATIVFVIAQID